MKWFKRTWLSIIRRPGKSFLLFLVVFMMANLLAGSLGVIQTSATIKDVLKESIAPKVSFVYEKEYKENKIKYTRDVTIDEMKQYNDVINQLANDENVIAFEQHYSLDVFAKYRDLGWQPNDTREFKMGFYSTNVIESTYFKENDHRLASLQGNRFLTEKELQSTEVYMVVDQMLGSVYEFGGATVPTGLNVLDNEVTLVLKSTDGERIYEYEFPAKVVGVLFNRAKEPFHNCVYVSNTALLNLVDDANAYFTSVGADEITYELQSANVSMDTIEDVESFMSHNDSIIDTLPEGFIYSSSVDTYKKNIGPIENLDTIAKVIFLIAIVATIVILGLVIVFFISDRKKEMGIYLSVGEKKKHIVYQLLVEIVLISTVAISCASLTGLFLGDKLSNYMLEVQRYVQREQEIGIPNLKPTYKPVRNGISIQTRDDIIDNYEVKPNMEYFLTIFVVGELSVIISTVLPMMYLSSLKPKEIML
ncbi:MAG: ABC transporter permease [Erysipelotrichaceae bacterium]|nr:ABC transporter permease [Erysipelotrichaceae bacterium]